MKRSRVFLCYLLLGSVCLSGIWGLPLNEESKDGESLVDKRKKAEDKEKKIPVVTEAEKNANRIDRKLFFKREVEDDGSYKGEGKGSDEPVNLVSGGGVSMTHVPGGFTTMGNPGAQAQISPGHRILTVGSTTVIDKK